MFSLPASIKRIRYTEKRWKHHVSHCKSMGAFCCHGNQNFDSICPKTLCSLSPTRMMLHIKFDKDWPTGLWDIQVQKCEIFVTQVQATPKWAVYFGPKSNLTELLCLSWLPAHLMMIRSKMNELAWRHYKSMGNVLDAQVVSVVSGQIWPKFKLVWDFMHVLVTCKYKRIGSKATEKRWRHHFPHYKSMGAFCCHGHQSFYPICLKTLCSLSPPPVMLHIKFDQDWPAGLRDIQVQKCKIFII